MVNGLAITLMVLALGQPAEAPQAVDNVEAPNSKVRVYVGGVDVDNVEQVFTRLCRTALWAEARGGPALDAAS